MRSYFVRLRVQNEELLCEITSKTGGLVLCLHGDGAGKVLSGMLLLGLVHNRCAGKIWCVQP